MNKRRITSLLICITMLLTSILTSLLSAFAFAAEGGSFYSSFEDGEDYSKYVHGKIAKDENEKPKVHGVSNSTYNDVVSGEYIDCWDTIAGSTDYMPDHALKNIKDRNPSTKWVSFGNAPSQENPIWAEMKMTEEKIVRTYSITSAGYEKGWDPKSWKYFGSNDGKDWQLMDSQTDQVFSDRFVTNVYTFENETAYEYYRLEITANDTNGSFTQFADFAMGSNEIDAEKDPNVSIGSGPISSWTGNANQGWTGSKALQVVGTHAVDEHAYRYNVLYEGLNIPVGENTQLSYLIFPDIISSDDTAYDYDYANMYMAVDLLFTNGTYLSDLAAVDQYGHGMSAKEQGESKTLYTKQWNEIYSNIGDVAEGLTIDSILVVYDNPFEGTYEKAPIQFRSYFDDITIETVKPVVHEHLSDYVNTLRGTNDRISFSRGLNTPMVAVPNGFNFWTPATTENGHRIYRYTDGSLTHFTISHEPSYWIGDRGTFQFMANTSISSADMTNVTAANRKASFSHENETAKAHYYGVQFDEGGNASGVKMEVTPTNYAAAVRFTFPKDSENRNVIFDSVNAAWDGSLEFSEDGKSFTAKTSQTTNGMPAMHIYGEFDVAASETSVVYSNAARGMISFTEGTTEVTMKIATSFISIDQAKHNLELDISDSDTFDTVFERAQGEWDDLLGTIEIEGASYNQMVTFYSNMYRMYAYPNLLSENTGTKENPDLKYASPYNNGAVTDGTMYYNNGFWDTYRTTWASYALFTPEKNKEMLNGLVQHYNDQGWIPRWIAPGGANSMVGTSSDVIFGDAIMRGQEFDYDNAYLSALRNASVVSSDLTNGGRSGLETSIFLRHTPGGTNYPFSWLIEGYINDFGIANMAKTLRDKVEDTDSDEYRQYNDEYQYFINRAQQYVYLYDESVGFFQSRGADGEFRSTAETYDPIDWGSDYTETNGWNMAFTVPQDGQGLANLYGGREALGAKLDELFNTKGEYKLGGYSTEMHEMKEARELKMGQYAHSNQPSHHLPYMYLYAGQPSKTQEKVREIMDRLYVGESIGQGYCGDEDNGEMSAWYVLSALGIYPVNIGSGEFAIGSPLFTKATVHLENGKELVINAPNNSSENIYVQSVKLGGEDWNKTYFAHSDIAEGAVIDFKMGSTPSDWGTDEDASPTSITKDDDIPAFDKDITVTDATILGSIPTENQTVNSFYTSESVTNPLSLSDNSSITVPTFTTDSISLYYSFESVQNVNMYTITSGTDVNGAPNSWSLWGSDDNQTWVKLDERSDQSFRWEKYTRPFALDGTASFQNYRLDINGTNGSEVLNISEIELLGSKEGFDSNLLKKLVEEARSLEESKYTPTTWSTMKDALEKAETLLADENSTPAQLSEAYYNLKAAIEALEEVNKVDKSALQALVDECKALNRADYTDESWENFSEMLNEAVNTLNNETASQAQVDKAFTALTKAKAALVPLSPTVDKSALQALVDECKALNRADYTDESWENFSEVLNEAEALLNNENATQDQVNSMLTSLANAKAALVPLSPTVDKTALQALVDECLKLNRADYTEESWESFSETLGEAENLLSSETATQGQINNMITSLKNAKDNLIAMPKVDKSALQDLVDECKELNGTDYTDESWENFSQVLNEAEALLNNEAATQAQVNSMLTSLANAKEALVSLSPKVDKTALQALVDECQALNGADYTDESWEAFSEVLNEAQALINNENATQDQVNSMLTSLANAKSALVPITYVDKTDLEKEIAKAKEIESNLDKYEEAGKAEFIEALKSAKEVLAKEDATQEEINAAMNLLKTSINALKLASKESSSTDSNSSNNSEVAQTGDADTAIYIALIVITIAAVFILRKKLIHNHGRN